MTTFSESHAIPRLGHGVGLRRQHQEQIDAFSPAVDWLEIISENFMGFGGEPLVVLDRFRERFPMIPHGVNLSVGGPDPLDREYLARLKALVRRVRAPYFSDHLCYTAIDQTYFHDLLPLPFTSAAVKHVAGRIRQVSDAVEAPFAIENISYYAEMPAAEMNEFEFLGAIADEADCGILLDVNNIVVNANNHGFDPVAALDDVPLHRVVQLHLAGHRYDEEEDLRVDDHGSEVDDPTWALYAEVVRRMGAVPTLMEWDNDVPALDVLLAEAKRARAVETEVLAAEAEAS